LTDCGTNIWTAVLFFGDIERLPYRSSVRSHVQTTGTKDPNVHRYVIACEIKRAKGAVELADTIRRLSSQWEHPLSGLWVVETMFKAQDIRSALLSHMEPQDRLFITEAGQDRADSNALHASGAKVTKIGPVTQLAEVQGRHRMLTAIFSRSGKKSRHLTAATSENLKSA
jgi:hypothetical protein